MTLGTSTYMTAFNGLRVAATLYGKLRSDGNEEDGGNEQTQLEARHERRQLKRDFKEKRKAIKRIARQRAQHDEAMAQLVIDTERALAQEQAELVTKEATERARRESERLDANHRLEMAQHAAAMETERIRARDAERMERRAWAMEAFAQVQERKSKRST